MLPPISKVRAVRLPAALLLLVTGLTAPLLAKSSLVNATVVGTVADSQGAVIPGATVTVRNLGTNISQNGVTDDEGRFRVANLQPGDYRLAVELTGFKTFEVQKLKLDVNQTARFDVTLQVGQISDKVEVTGEVALLKTDTQEIGSVVYEKLMKELPLNGRNFLQLAGLTTGAAGLTTTSGNGDYTPNFNGASNNQNQYQLDGGDNTSISLMVPILRPPLDSIREFKVQTSQYSAEFGRTAIITAVTKSGTNAFHGSAWEFFRNDVFDARNFFAPSTPAYRQNQFGGTLGGPLMKNRLFFYTSYEGFRIRSGVNAQATVPTDLEKQGDFSQSTRFGASNIYDPFNLDATGQRIPFPGGKIPASRMHPGAAKLLKYYPQPNLPGQFPNLRLFPSAKDDDNRVMVRLDYKLSDKSNVFGRYSWETQPQFAPNAIPLMGTLSNPNFGHNVSASWTRVFTPKLVNELRGSYAWKLHYATNYNKELGYDNADTLPKELYGFPGINVGGYSTIGGAQYTTIPTKGVLFADTLAWTRGSHSLKYGYAYNWTSEARDFNPMGGASHTFGGFYTGPLNAARTSASIGQPFADLLLGVSDASGGLTSDKPGLFTPRRQLHHFFVHDVWQLTPKLTVNIGLRYELNLPAYFSNGQGAAYIDELPPNECTQYITLGGVQRCRDIVMVYPANARDPISKLLGGQAYKFPHRFLDTNYLFDVDKNNFAPRLGVAYRPTQKTVIRAGYGVFYDIGLSNLFTNMGLAAPFFVGNDRTFDRSKPPTGLPGNEFGKVPPSPTQFPSQLSPDQGGFIQAKWAEKSYTDGYAQSWNLHVQRLVRKTLSVQVGYVGNKTTHYPTGYSLNRSRPMPGNQQLNRPWPLLFSCDCFHSFGAGTYNSVQAEVEQRFSRGLGFRAGYTFGKTTNDYRWVQDEFDRRGGKGLADWDRRQVFYLTAVYDLPFGNDRQGFAAQLIKGWQIASILSMQSGGRYQVAVSADIANTGSRRVLLPNRIADGNLPEGERTLERFLDPSAFQVQGSFQYGNAGYAILEGTFHSSSAGAGLRTGKFSSARSSSTPSITQPLDFLPPTSTPADSVVLPAPARRARSSSV
ncbi:MAG: hypothetical protein DMG07_20455 [Acidobacteria bacterium]|nr:MAG: hypothetical protein DMG07_20455 [Acidobacteriota bacterium]